MQKRLSIAKITRPRLTEVLPRKRLFRIMDQNRSPFTWISGPAGSGKTTLVTSYVDARNLPCLWYQLDESDGDLATFFYYLGLAVKEAAPRVKKNLPLLTPEYLQGIPTFTKRYFENLCSRLALPFLIVFDNYHHVPAESGFHEMIRDALSVIPDGVRVIVNSRGTPPPSLATLTAYRKLQSIGWEDLKFDRNEISGFFKSEQHTKGSKELIDQVENLTTGWAAGLVLLLQRLKTSSSALAERERFKPKELFDYFASELFEKADISTQNFLLKISFLPHIYPKVAALISGNENAAKLLSELHQNNFFTERMSFPEPVYQYHPLFREFLQERARATFAQKELPKLQHHAAELLENMGQIEDAAELYRLSGVWDALARIILSNAQTMISQGRNRSLETWLNSMPASLLDQNPWLLYWIGVCRMPFNSAESHDHFDRALALLMKKGDAAGVYRSWSGAVESKVQEMGDTKRLERWVTLLFELMKKYKIPSREIEDEVTLRIFTAIPWVPLDPAFIEWRNRAMELIERDANPSLRLTSAFYLLAHYMWLGEYVTATSALDVLRQLTKNSENVSPLAYCMGRMCEGLYVWLTGESHRCYPILQEGLKRAEESGVHMWDTMTLATGTAASLCLGDLSQAKELLEKMALGLDKVRPFDRFYYHLNAAWQYMLLGNVQQALTQQNQAQRIELATNFLVNASENHFAMAIILRELGESKEAKENVAELHKTASRMGSTMVEYKALLLDAFLAFDVGNEQRGLDKLRQAMKLGSKKGFLYFYWWLPSMMTLLCTKALESDIEVEYVQSVIRKCKLVPKDPPQHLENWPWPIRITTLGRFEIMKDGKPIEFSRKAQKKPLQLLRMLIAAEGKEVREDRITDLLWPDAEGDAGHKALIMNVIRLRNLLDMPDAVTIREGRISLNPRLCWVDTSAFEHLLERARNAGKLAAALSHVQMLHKAMELYKGPFLVDDPDSWTVSYREKLSSKFLKCVDTLGIHMEQSKAYEEAIRIYQKGLEVDDLSEPYYQRLMVCYKKLGRSAEAVSLYKRFKKTLAAYDLEPSPETNAIHDSLRVKNVVPRT
jgi:LuxR family maltose regulon positive regulatory protein